MENLAKFAIMSWLARFPRGGAFEVQARGLELGGAMIAARRWASKKEASTRVLLAQMLSYETKKDLRKQSKPVGIT